LKKFIANRLSTEQRAKIRSGIAYVQQKWLTTIRGSEFLCRLHTVFLSRDLSLEARAVIEGRIRNLENRRSTEKVNYFLRRGVHRIEKGLTMPARRPLFGLKYIEEVAKAYSNATARDCDSDELAWAHDVLVEYFRVVQDDPIVRSAKQIFDEAQQSTPLAFDGATIPYAQEERELSFIAPKAFHSLAMRRRSVRFYDGRPVPRSALDRAIATASLSPSACNRQPFEFKIFDGHENTEKISSLAGGTAGFSHQIPCLIVIVGRLRAFSYARDRHAIYVDGGLAAMSLMFALETLGLASCPINWPDVRSRELEMATALKLSADERVVMLISVGYAQGGTKVASSKKLALDVLRTYENSESVAP